MRHVLYYGPKEIQKALIELGPPGTKGEGILASAADTFAQILRDGGSWKIEVEPDLEGDRIVISQ